MGTLSFTKPTDAALSKFLADQVECGFSYSEVGASADTPPIDYDIDRTQIELGRGSEVFEKAKVAVQEWRQFQLGWVEAWPPQSPIEVGRDVAVLGRRA